MQRVVLVLLVFAAACGDSRAADTGRFVVQAMSMDALAAEKLFVPTLCVLIGCAAGATIPAVTAQWPQPRTIQKWQQECVQLPNTASWRRDIELYSVLMRDRGEAGWEYAGMGGTASFCFKRPVP